MQDTEEEQEGGNYTAAYWDKWLEKAQNSTAFKNYVAQGKQAYREYERQDSTEQAAATSGADPVIRLCPIWWSSVDTVRAAYFSRIPKLRVTNEFEWKDVKASVMGLITKRLGEYHIKKNDFYEVITGTVLDFINADKATTQVVYKAAFEKIPLYSYENGETGELEYYETELEEGLDEYPEPYTGQVIEDGDNIYYNKLVEEKQEVRLKQLPFDQNLHTPTASSNCEIEDRAFPFTMSRDEAKKRFPKFYEMLPFKNEKGSLEKGEALESPDDFIEGYEIWCKRDGYVYWHIKGFTEVLDKQKDPYGLEGFFPSPDIILGSKPKEGMYPTPVFSHLRSIVEDLHLCYERVSSLLDGVRRRALVENNVELLTALNDLDGETFITVSNLSSMLEKGGIQNLVHFLPVKELVEALAETIQLESHFENRFYQGMGVSDILRGMSDPVETAAAQEIKVFAAQDRFKIRKTQIAHLVRDSIAMMIDLSLNVFSDEKIAKIVGYQYMDQEEQALFPEALALLRNDAERCIRIDIETDTTSYLDDLMRQQRQNVIVNTVNGGLEKAAQMLQYDAGYALVAMQTVLMSLEGIEGGSEFTSEVKNSITALIQKQQGMQDQPPPPDIEQLKIQLQNQKLMLENQRMQTDVAIRAQESQLKGQIESQKLMIEAQDKMHKQQLEAAKFQQKAFMDSFMQWATEQGLSIDSFKAQINARESMLEETRLAKEMDVRVIEALSAQPAQSPKPEQSPVTIINAPQAPTVNNVPPISPIIR